MAPRRDKRAALRRAADDVLLDLKLKQLPWRKPLRKVQRLVERLYEELEDRGLKFRPHVWIGEEWFCPDGVPGFAIPFYLTHERLVRLERRQMLEVEGASEAECMRILRHEAGHAIDNAYRLHFRRDWQRTFGSFAKRYPEYYRPRPNSRAYVHHLNAWYAQSHPAEDFAETFAVWLNPRSRWKQQYADWPALKKLLFVEELMHELRGVRPKIRNTKKVDALYSVDITLGEHYARKKIKYGAIGPQIYDRHLNRIFSSDDRYLRRPTAASFLRSRRNELVELVSHGAGTHRYTVDQVFRRLTERSKELKLRLASPEGRARQDTLILLTVAVMNVILGGKNRVAL